MTPWQVLIDTLGGEVRDRLDGDLLPALYAAVSVPTAVIRSELRSDGLLFVDPQAGQWPTAQELEEASKKTVVNAQRRGVGLGVASGLVGAVAM